MGLTEKTPQRELRDATRSDHDAIEQVHPIRAVLTGLTGRDGYTRLLIHLARWYQPLEAQLRVQPALTILPMAESRWHKTDWLMADLGILGVSACPQPALPADLPIASDAAGWLGIAYTLEGATMGGAMLSPQIRACLGASTPSRFYQGYGDENGRYWGDLIAHLNCHLSEPESLRGATLGARNCFTMLRSWLMRLDP